MSLGIHRLLIRWSYEREKFNILSLFSFLFFIVWYVRFSGSFHYRLGLTFDFPFSVNLDDHSSRFFLRLFTISLIISLFLAEVQNLPHAHPRGWGNFLKNCLSRGNFENQLQLEILRVCFNRQTLTNSYNGELLKKCNEEKPKGKWRTSRLGEASRDFKFSRDFQRLQ